MPTPAASATAETGAPGSARNTARAASRITWSLRAAWALRPLRAAAGALVSVVAMPCTLPPNSERNAPLQKMLERNGPFR